MYFLMVMTLIVGFVEGLGIVLFLPILQNGFGNDRLSLVLKHIFGALHIGYSFTLLLFLILVFFTFRSIFLIYYARYTCGITADLSVILRRTMIRNIFNADYMYLLKKEVGYIDNAVSREISCVIETFTTCIYILSYAIYAFVYILLALLLNPRITGILLAFSPIAIFLMRNLNRLTTKASIDMSDSYGRFHSILIQALSKMKYLKATQAQAKVSEIIDRENKNLGHLTYKLGFLASFTKDAFEPLVVLIVVCLLFYYVNILGKTVSEVIFLAFLFLQIARQFLSVQASYRKFLSSMGSIETFGRIEKELDDNKEDLHLKDGKEPDFAKDIVFNNVTLIFPNGKSGLSDIALAIKPKSITAFVGHSGSGKSTVANMITGIIRPTKGDVFFGDVNYNRLNLKSLREKTGYVTQEDIIFNASIMDNISLWNEKPDAAGLSKAIGIAHIAGFIDALPGKQKSMLGDNGLNISGGQRQRITIARELYKNAELLILDEATSALDSESEKRIYENLKEFKGIKTMVIIAHRLSTIKNADYIYVFHNGRIVEEGTFDDLYSNKDTRFYQICQLQSV